MKKQTTKEVLILVFYVVNLLYAFYFWGVNWGILNLFFPIALPADAFKLLINHGGLK